MINILGNFYYFFSIVKPYSYVKLNVYIIQVANYYAVSEDETGYLVTVWLVKS